MYRKQCKTPNPGAVCKITGQNDSPKNSYVTADAMGQWGRGRGGKFP